MSLQVFNYTPATISEVVEELQKAPAASAVSTNQNLPPYLVTRTTHDLKLPDQTITNGHCKTLVTRTKKKGVIAEEVKLGERNDKRADPPKITIAGNKNKVFLYHVLIAHKAYSNPGGSVTLGRLREVKQDKQGQSSETLSILHLCGNAWCMNADHYAIGSKRFNEGQTSCHRGLQSALSLPGYIGVQQSYCKHVPKCWTHSYKEPYARGHIWSTLT